MFKKAIVTFGVLSTLAAVGLGTAYAANPVSFIHFAPEVEDYIATSGLRSVSFLVRVPRSALAPRDAQIDVTNISLGTNFNMEMMVGCTNETAVSGTKTGSWPLSSADDFTLTCPIFRNVVAVQGGLGISN
jgi:hypothetical protein